MLCAGKKQELAEAEIPAVLVEILCVQAHKTGLGAKLHNVRSKKTQSSASSKKLNLNRKFRKYMNNKRSSPRNCMS